MQHKSISLEQRINIFSALGKTMRDSAAGVNEGPARRFSELIDIHKETNPWFTPENVRKAIRSAGENLDTENLSSWLSHYPGITENNPPSRVGVVMAGNIPLVGFHDLLCVLITGNRLIAKLSSKDELLMRAVAEFIIEYDPSMSEYINLTTDRLSDFDMVIATGSDNTSRYFEYYFRNYTSMIRKNRNSVAVIDGNETDEELMLLGNDIFDYFGLGCRSISKLYIPPGFDISRFTDLWQPFERLRSHDKYAVNYDHNKAVMIVNRQPFTDTGFLLMREDISLTPPMAVLNYGIYPSSQWLAGELGEKRSSIQCISGHGYIPFGKTQHPRLWDYADDIDTILFLLKKNTIR